MHRCVCVAGLDTNNLYMEVYQKYSRGHAESLIKHPNRSVQFIENISLDEMLFFFFPFALALNSPALLYPSSTWCRTLSFLSSAVPTHVEPIRIQPQVLPTQLARTPHPHPDASKLPAQPGSEHAAFPSCSR